MNLSIESIQQYCENNVRSSTAELSVGHFSMTDVKRALRLRETQGHPQAFADSAKYDCLFKNPFHSRLAPHKTFLFPFFLSAVCGGVCVGEHVCVVDFLCFFPFCFPFFFLLLFFSPAMEGKGKA